MKNKNLKKPLAIALLFFLNLGCASTPNKNVRTESAKATSAPAILNSTDAKLMMGSYISLARRERVSSESCPNNAKSWRRESLNQILNYASNCVQLGQFERVEQLGQFLAQNHHQSPWGPYYLSLAADARSDYKRGLWMVELALKRDPNNALLHYQKGRLHWSLNEYAVAVRSYQLAIEKNSKFVDAHIFLGQMFYRDQNPKLALAHFESAKSALGSSIDATLGIAECQIQLGNAKAAVAHYEELVGLAPTRVAFRYKLAGLYENVVKDLNLALATYKRVREMSMPSRAPAEDMPTDINERIQRIEAQLAAQAKEATPEASTAKLDANQKVKK